MASHSGIIRSHEDAEYAIRWINDIAWRAREQLGLRSN